MEARPRFIAGGFIGRERELDSLLAQLADVRTGRGGIAMLVGEPGIGKTRVAQELADHARRDGAAVLWGCCFEGEWPRPYGPWVEALGGYAREVEPERSRAQVGPWASPVGQLVWAVHAALTEIRSPALRSPEQERFRLYDAVAQFLLTAAEDQPVVLVLDDLHWADRDSLGMLRYIARVAVRARLLVVGAYRELELRQQHPLADVLAVLKRETDYERIRLRGFSESEVAAWLAGAAGRELPPALVRRIHTETGGNPFYLREVFRHLVEEGKIPRDPEPMSVDPGVVDFGVPEGVRQVVGRRLSHLSEETATVLRVAAASPDRFDFQLLQAVVGLPDEALLDCIDEALRAGLIHPVTGAAETYDFAHAIVRHTLYDSLSPGRRLRLHWRVGEALEALYRTAPEAHLAELAFHFCRAVPVGDLNKALEYAARAAERAARLLAYDDAAAYYERALRILELEASRDGPPSPEVELRRCDLLLALGESLRRAGHGALARPSPAKQALLEATTIVRRLRPRIGDHEAGLRLARAALGYRGVLVDAGAVDSVRIGLLEEALETLGEVDSSLRAMLLARLASELYFANQPDRRVALSRAAVAMARRVGDPAALAHALQTSHLARWGPDNVEERIAITAELLTLADTVGDPELTLLGQGWRVTDLLELGDIAAVDAAIATHARLADALRQPFYRFNSAMWRAMRAILDGRLGEAEELALQMLSLGRQIQDPDAEMLFGIQLFMLRREQGRLGELEDAMRRLVDRYATIPAARCRLAALYAELGRETEARAEFDRLAASDFAGLPRDLTWLSSATLLADVCAFLGDARQAATLYALLLPYAERTVVVDHAVACDGAVSRTLGLLAAVLGRREEAARHFEHALALHERLGARPLLARTRYEYAKMLALRGRRGDRARLSVLPWPDPDRPLALVNQSLVTARELGMTRLEEQARALRDSVDPARHPTTPFGVTPPEAVTRADRLTPREVDVLRLIAAGRTNKEIAAELIVGVPTVERHITHLYGKIGARRRAEATVYALNHGLTLPPAP